jgi:hypothetical protein
VSPSPRHPGILLLLALVAIAMAILAGTVVWALARGGAPGPLVVGPPPSFDAPDFETEILLGAGDIARCDSDGDEATARLLDALEGTIFTAGDNAYDRGTAEEFARCYGPTWGRHLERTRFPVAGNHDWGTAGAAGYKAYFGPAAHPDGVTWYSADLGTWHVIVLDTTCVAIGGCGDESAQLDWLRDDLDSSDAGCALAIMHHPRHSSGQHGSDETLEPMWRVLHDAGVELAIAGHDHDYERFAPQGPDGERDDAAGVRQFVVGTGGTHLREFEDVRANSEARDDDTLGVLRLALARDGYGWDFVPVAGGDFTDTGTGRCH